MDGAGVGLASSSGLSVLGLSLGMAGAGIASSSGPSVLGLSVGMAGAGVGLASSSGLSVLCPSTVPVEGGVNSF